MSETNPRFIFDEAFLNSLNGAGAAFERGQIVRTAKHPNAGDFRERLEIAAAKYPVEKRPALVGRIRSLDDIESLSAISELLVFDHLMREFGDVQVEPSLACVEGKTPDFFVPSADLAVEVATLFKSPNPHFAAIVETINTLKSESKILMFHVNNLPPNENPRLSEVRAIIWAILAAYDGRPQSEHFERCTSQGITLSGDLSKGRIEHPVIGSLFTSYGFSADDPDYKASIRQSVLEKKLKKYRRLASAGIKLLLVLYSQNDWLEEDDFDEILFGDEELLLSEHAPSQLNRPNPFIASNRHQALSGVLIYSPKFSPQWLLVSNPYTSAPLMAAASRLERAFSAKKVLTPRELLDKRKPAKTGIEPDGD